MSSKEKICKTLLRSVVLPLVAVIVSTSGLNAQIFYKISGKGIPDSYIFGTHHLAPIAMLDSVNGWKEAFGNAKTIVGEVDFSTDTDLADTQARLIPYMTAPKDSALSNLLSAEEFEKISKKFSEATGLPESTLVMLDRLKPMVAATTFASTLIRKNMPECDTSKSLDSYFQQLAVAAGKDVAGLETLEYQANVLFNTLPISLQLEELIKMLDDVDEVVNVSKKLNELYFARDIKGLQQLSDSEDTHPEFTRAILLQRNAQWLEKLPEILGAGPVFIAVGALHIPGENGILAGLERMGYQITPLY